MSARFYVIYLCDFSNMFIQENNTNKRHIQVYFNEIKNNFYAINLEKLACKIY